MRTGKDYHRDELNNPTMFEILGNISGKKILDLGCGEGYNARIMAKKGAKVWGVDFSKKMIDFAIQKEKKDKLGIVYHPADAYNLKMFKNNTIDIVVCFMALQDIRDYQKAIKEAYRVLLKSGRFLFSIPHPCFETTEKQNYKRKLKDKLKEEMIHFKVKDYFNAHSYTVPWKMKRLTQHFETTSFHRTLTHYVDALRDAKFLISRVKEPKPSKKGIRKHPIMKLHLIIPQSVVVEAVKL
ncbi:MAG: hypothetical protein AMJ90_07210 [candidate division Zixibacteria bacterium SM23_73_2]|nr:MAG: hypothetical protein AMJ90_07210 [candidate division Zixibacteria bacterium SM23_73_2]